MFYVILLYVSIIVLYAAVITTYNYMY